MLTPDALAVDSYISPAAAPPPAAPSRAVMWSVTEIAARDGITRQAVSKKVGELAPLGLTIERDALQRVSAVNVVEYDRLRGRTDDPSKAAPNRTAAAEPAAVDPDSYNEALRQKTWYDAERRKLEIDELKGELVRAQAVGVAIDQCGEEIAVILDRLPMAADDVAAAFTRGGLHELRLILKRIGSDNRREIADALDRIVIAKSITQAPAPDEWADQE